MDRERIRRFLGKSGLEVGDVEAEIRGNDPVIPSRFPAGELTAVVMALVGRSAADLWVERGGEDQDVWIDVPAAAARLGSFALQEVEYSESFAANPTTGMYEASDGWIQTHGGFPHLRDGILNLLGSELETDSIASAIKEWTVEDLDAACAERRLCATPAYTVDEWNNSPQGRVLHPLPVVTVKRIGDGEPRPLPFAQRPLSDVRVLDLTRVIAGPSVGRTLAAMGAEVLRIDGEHMSFIESFVIDTGHGKRNGFLDLRQAEARARLAALARDANVFVNSYRRGALESLGFGPEELAAANPGLVYVHVDCYGQAGPWAGRRGWEQIAQSASGISQHQFGDKLESPSRIAFTPAGDPRPQIIPAVFTDNCTGYIAAYGALEALRRQRNEGGSWLVEASLVRSCMWLTDVGGDLDPTAATGYKGHESYMLDRECDWGHVRFLGPVINMSATPPHWMLAPQFRGASPPAWQERDQAR